MWQTILVENQRSLRLSVAGIPDQIRSWLREPQPKEQALFHGRDAEFKEIGVFLDQELKSVRHFDQLSADSEHIEGLLEIYFPTIVSSPLRSLILWSHLRCP